MSIRSATPRDIKQISLLVTSLAHFYLNNSENNIPDWLSNTLTQKAFLTRIRSDEYVNFVYERQEKIIAYISIKKPNHLYHLFVSEHFQGKGIARLLWQHILNTGQYSTFTLRSSVYAIPIYKRFGFCEIGSLDTKDGVCFQSMELKF